MFMKIRKNQIKSLSLLFISILIFTFVVIGVRMLLHQTDHLNNDETISCQEDLDNVRGYLRQVDERCSQMSENELLRYKSVCLKTLEDIHFELDSDSLNPEERHEDILSKRYSEQELEIVK